MRISDWSSDVCSSDLGIHAWIAPAHRSALPAWRCGRGAEVVGESTELQRLDPVDHRRELRQVVRRVAAGAIEQGDAGAAFDRRQAPLHHAVQAHALQRAEATGQAQDRKSTRLNSVTNAQLVCRLLLEK